MSDKQTHGHGVKGWSVVSRVLVFLLLLVLVAGGVAAYVFRDALNLDALQRYVRYLNVSEDSKTGRFVYDESNTNRYADLSGGLAVASSTGLSLYDQDGLESASVQAAMSVPVLQTGGALALSYDAGGYALNAAGHKRGAALHIQSQRPILDADIARDDSICYLSSESGYKSVLYVYNKEQALIYRWLSASQYFMRCAVCEGAGFAAVAVLGQEDGMFRSSVALYRTDAEEVYRTIPIGNTLVYDLRFVSQDRLCVLTEQAVYFYDLDGQRQGSFSFGESYLKDYTFDGSGYLTLVMNLYQAGNQYTLVTLAYDGTELGRVSPGEQILDVTAAGKYLAVLTSSKLSIFDPALKEYDVSDNTTGAANVVMRDDGSAVLLANGHGTLYVP